MSDSSENIFQTGWEGCGDGATLKTTQSLSRAAKTQIFHKICVFFSFRTNPRSLFVRYLDVRRDFLQLRQLKGDITTAGGDHNEGGKSETRYAPLQKYGKDTFYAEDISCKKPQASIEYLVFVFRLAYSGKGKELQSFKEWK